MRSRAVRFLILALICLVVILFAPRAASAALPFNAIRSDGRVGRTLLSVALAFDFLSVG